MAMDRRPTRPTSRVPQPSSGPPKPPTARIPAPTPSRKPTTRSMPQGRPPTGRAERHPTSRGVPTRRPSNTPMIIGGVGGGAVLLIILIVFMASPNKKRPEASNPRPAAEPVDVAGLEREGMKKCDEGLHLIQGCDSLMRSSNLSTGDKARLKGDLSRGLGLLTDGSTMLDRASQMTNFKNKYDTTKYGQAMKLARGKLLELK